MFVVCFMKVISGVFLLLLNIASCSHMELNSTEFEAMWLVVVTQGLLVHRRHNIENEVHYLCLVSVNVDCLLNILRNTIINYSLEGV